MYHPLIFFIRKLGLSDDRISALYATRLLWKSLIGSWPSFNPITSCHITYVCVLVFLVLQIPHRYTYNNKNVNLQSVYTVIFTLKI